MQTDAPTQRAPESPPTGRRAMSSGELRNSSVGAPKGMCRRRRR